ncbi:hypothetical protein [Shimwellia blattae]|uniref:DprA winged helix domain-containing protein n=1 Tax=Shimwellia blattae (strain ATCC 29907 / DSM 4481 / JCM 1650 / NBRC 105725 / CDC 9005-74) TaxID=630626 RepID=I2B9J6_SHIBC|nr:hypothetical protein [Shimwellia blattae]AFJ47200.1 hypothetical protein EBL_c21090 [Shimwellia blattae DSM 4481 = NBRC 105725]GAB82271.1 hypothetical protein EB105725_21_00690 [Shimwellia blattae DSM 4481 = NBRC 105725]VDY64688.1 Uncharacterised protein [Shimwellia blattae]VEC22792.1 Uncharacterised protein [Shimwellia blattae]
MFNEQGMTDVATAVLGFLHARKWTHIDDIARATGFSPARCQLILTQLELASLADNKDGQGMQFRRCTRRG